MKSNHPWPKTWIQCVARTISNLQTKLLSILRAKNYDESCAGTSMQPLSLTSCITQPLLARLNFSPFLMECTRINTTSSLISCITKPLLVRLNFSPFLTECTRINATSPDVMHHATSFSTLKSSPFLTECTRINATSSLASCITQPLLINTLAVYVCIYVYV